ncbi:MAG: hypothetical protein JWR39_1760 [Devosia sp.]|nr:hypothetical protein [Devosia sp.]
MVASVLALVLGLAGPALAGEAATRCSALAASPYDAGTPPGQGKLIAEIEAEAAIQACQSAIENGEGDARMVFQLGRAFDAAGRYEDAISNYQAAIAMGFPLAEVALGGLYELGLGLEQNAGEAVRLYQKAFDEAKLPIAAANLGYVFDAGIGVEADRAKAARFYEIASDAGISWASTSLGWLYEQGLGVEADYPKAVELYQAAAAMGDADAANNLAVAYEQGRGGLPQSIKQAMAYFETAIKGGSGLAMANLADVYAYGKGGVPKDHVKARELYRAAIDSDDASAVARAQNSLAWHFVLSNTELEEAEGLAAAAVAYDQGNPAALDTLGWIKHLRGDDTAALELLEQAAKIKPATSQLAHLGAVQAALGDKAAARTSYAQALAKLGPDLDDATVDIAGIQAWLATN